MRFSQTRVMVVGAASGLGAAAARAFAREGASTTLVDRDRDGLSVVADACAAVGSRSRTLVGDASAPDTAQAALALAEAVDVLMVAAAIDPLGAKDVCETSIDDWNAVLSVNVGAPFLFARAVLPGMVARRCGAILFVGSIASLKPTPKEAAYAVSKAAVLQLARSIALDYAPFGIRANCLCPGYLEAVMRDRREEMTPEGIEARARAAAAAVPLGREGRYDEIAELAVILCDPQVSGYVTGQAIVADGGASIS